MPLTEWVSRSLAELAAETIPITHDLALEAYSLPGHFHEDPADRLLVASARLLGLTFLTADERILSYPAVRSLNARR